MSDRNIPNEIVTTKQQIERFKKLIDTMQGLSLHEKRKHFDMANWGQRTECGTTMCAAGFCGSRKWFQNRGFSFVPPRRKGLGATGTLKLGKTLGWEALCKFFSLEYDPFFDEPGDEAEAIFRTPRTVREVISAAKKRIRHLKEAQSALQGSKP